MKKIYIYPNLSEERYVAKVKRAIEVLNEKGHECYLNDQDGALLYGKDHVNKGNIEDCDLIVSLGGDGTFLRGCKLAIEHDLPICGINCGNLGFLCACQLNSIEDLDIDALSLHELSMLKFEYQEKTYEVLNEVVAGKDYFGGTVELEYRTKDRNARFRGDGLIVCTATGSTAYNLSAGGKIFKEEDNLIGITPICAHTRGIGPVYVDSYETVEICLSDNKYTASIFADGIYVGPLNKIEISYSDRKIKILNNK